ncbi:MAG: oligosaccharide flippase family protein [Chloroflexota bacterium]
MRRSLLKDLLIVAGLFLLPLAFFWQVTLGSRTLLPGDNLYQFQPWAAYREQQGVPAIPHNSLLSDLVLENLAWKQFIRESIANHEIPLWNPYNFAGTPFLAAGQHSAMYPFSAIYYVMPLEKAYGWFTVSQIWLAGLMMYLFARGLGIGRFGATIAAIAYQLSGFFLASVVFQMIIAAAAWFPFLLLMVEYTIRQRPLFGKPTVVPWVALGAIGLGMEILAGHVEFTYYALLVMGFWSACRLGALLWQSWRSGDLGSRWRQQLFKPAVSLLLLVVLGLGVGAIQFVPLFELASHNFREGSASFADVQGYAYPPRHALAFLMPNVFGSPAQHDYVDVFSGQQVPFAWQRPDGSSVTDTYWEVRKNYVEAACYVGLLTLVLAAIALINARFEKAPHAKIETVGPYRAILMALSVISLLFVFGTPVYALLYYGLPAINQLHSPFRWVFPLTLCLAVLAGFGAEALQRARGESVFGTQYWRQAQAESFTFRLAKNIGYGLVGIGTAVLGFLLLSRIFFERLHGPLESLLHKLAGADTAFPNVETFYSVEFRSILFFGLFLIACGCVIRVSRCPIYLPRWLGRRPIWQAMALVTLILDLVVASAGFNPAADPQWLAFEPPAITWLKQHNPTEWRFAALEWPGTTKTMNANVGWLRGLQDIAGYDSLIPKQYVEYMRQIQPQGQLIYNRIAPLNGDSLDSYQNSAALNQLAVKYLISEKAIDTAKYSQYQQVYQDEAVRIYENKAALPRAFIVQNQSDCTTAKTDNVSPAQITESRFDQVTVNASGSDNQSCLIVADSYFPGWRAYIRPQDKSEDQEFEKEIPVKLALGNFRSVELPGGNWTIRFRYSPPSFQLGAFITFMSGVVLLFALLIWLWQMFYVESTGESSGVRRIAKNSIAPIVLNLFNRSIDLAFAAIMLRVLGPADAGIYYYAVVVFGWFDTLTNFGLNLLLTREVSMDRSSAGRYLLNSSILRLLLAGAGVPVLAIFLLIQVLLQQAHLAQPLEPIGVAALLLLYVGLVPNSISYGLTALFYAFEKAEIPAATSTVSAILKAVFGLGALLAGWGVVGLAGVSIVLNLITLAILSIQARGLLAQHATTTNSPAPRATLDRSLIRGMVYASWPLMLNNLLSGLFYKIDVTLLEPSKGPKVVGQYSTAYKWLDALGIIPSLFTMALLPLMSRQAKEDKAGLQRSYHFAVKLLVSLALPVAVVTTFIAPALIGVLGGTRFLPEGAIALQLMIWFAPVGWINSLTNYLLIALDQQRPMRWAFVMGVGFNIIANLLFIPLFSYKAAAVITILSEVVLQVAFYRLLRKSLGTVPWIEMLWKSVAAAAIMFGLLWIVWPINNILALAAAIIVYPATLLVLRPFSTWELERIAALLPGSIRRFVERRQAVQGA